MHHSRSIRSFFGISTPMANATTKLFDDMDRAINSLVEEANAQDCDIVFAAYPNRDVLVTGLNGRFDVDRVLADADPELLDILTPLDDTDRDDLRGDIAADHVFAHEFDSAIPRGNFRGWMDSAAECSENTVEYYELADGEVHHERTYHAYDGRIDTLPGGGGDGADDITDALEDAGVDAEEIVRQLEEDEDDDSDTTAD